MSYPNPFDLKHQRAGPSGDLVEEFLSSYDNYQTRRNYRTDLSQFFGEEGATRTEAAAVETEDIVEFLGEKASSLARSTLQRRLETFKSFFRWLSSQGLVEGRPIGKGQKTKELIDRVLQEAGGDADEEDGPGADGDSWGDGPHEEGPGPEEGSGTSDDKGAGERGADPGGSEAGTSSSVGGSGSSSGSARGRESGRTHRSKRGHKKSASHTARRNASQDSNDGGSHAQDQSFHTGAVSDDEADSLGQAGDSGGEEGPNSGSDSFGLPRWAPEGFSEDVDTLDLETGEHVPLGRLPSALHYALSEIADSETLFDPTRLSVRYAHSLSVQVYFYEDRGLIEARIQVDVLDGIREGDAASIAQEPVPYRALLYLNERGWALPSELYDQVAPLPGGARAENSTSEEYPIWTQESAHLPASRFRVSMEITGAIAKGFQIGRDEELYIRKRL